MRPLPSRVADAASLAGLALLAGGGTAFFLFARVLFDRVPAFSPHPAFDAGRVVGPIVEIANGTQIAVALLVLAVAHFRRNHPSVARGPNRALGAAAALILAIALAERFALLPAIVSIRESLGPSGFDGDAVSPERRRFGALHGVDMLAHLVGVLSAWTGLLLERASVRAGAA